MSEILFWEPFWKLILPSLLLVVGLLMGVVATLVVPISDEDRKKAAKEIDEKIKGFTNEFSNPLNVGIIGLKVIYFYLIGVFIIIIAGDTLSNITGVPTIYDKTIKIAIVLAEYFPTIFFSIVIVYLGQQTIKVVGSLFRRIINIIYLLSNLKTSSDIHE